MYILGISAFYHDSAAALVHDGRIIAAAQEERFSRIKHDPGYPTQAVDYCLRAAGIDAGKLDYVVFYEKPLQKFDRLLETYLAFAPRGFSSFSQAIPRYLKQKLYLRKALRDRIGAGYRGPLVFTEHHESHAASAFFPSPFEEAAILTVDAVGEWATASIGVGRGERIEILKEMRFPHSVGLLYSAFTYFCGFKVNSGEYKLMGLAPYGEPKYRDLILSKIVQVYEDGSIWLDSSYFNYAVGLTMTSKKFHRLFGQEPRKPESPLTQLHMDLAASIQSVIDEILLRMATCARRLTGCANLCLAGGVALNCVANGKLQRSRLFENIWIQPAAGDAGASVGAALFVWHQLLEKKRKPEKEDSQAGSLLGPDFSSREIAMFLEAGKIPHRRFEREEELLSTVSRLLCEGKIVGWFQDRLEFGPRALGARSILGDPRCGEMQSRMNLKIKYRESFRPFAPAVLEEKAQDYFEIDCPSPYMLLVAPVREDHRRQLRDTEKQLLTDPDLRRRVNLIRSDIPAVTHLDYSARLQTVSAARNRRFHALLTRFCADTGCPVLVNTSFNIRGEPIVCTPADAHHCFLNTEMDALVLGDFLVEKDQLRTVPGKADTEVYKASFTLD
ncbi:MAG: hypothetical protein EHM61_09450 [Acidobacteria bacterium]|nr:MAG: hypothetical protein EHM61_09450 [Acidobacteriota bacterium]